METTEKRLAKKATTETAKDKIFEILKSNNFTIYEAQEILDEVKLLLYEVKVNQFLAFIEEASTATAQV